MPKPTVKRLPNEISIHGFIHKQRVGLTLQSWFPLAREFLCLGDLFLGHSSRDRVTLTNKNIETNRVLVIEGCPRH